eukprot:6212010-Pleurochrysis_carterae.AAC.1
MTVNRFDDSHMERCATLLRRARHARRRGHSEGQAHHRAAAAAARGHACSPFRVPAAPSCAAYRSHCGEGGIHVRVPPTSMNALRR